MMLNKVRAKFVLGLTATPERQDGHQKKYLCLQALFAIRLNLIMQKTLN